MAMHIDSAADPAPRELRWIIAVAVALSMGCSDSLSDPMGVVMARETGAAPDIGESVPRLVDVWIGEGGASEDVAVSAWQRSWTLPTAEGRLLRSESYIQVAEILATRLEDDDVSQLLGRIESTLQVVGAWTAGASPSSLVERVGMARESVERSHVLLEAGERRSSLVATFEAADYLLEMAPVYVATRLLGAAERGARRFSSAESYTEQTLVRVERLIDAAREAMRDADYARAIRGSYYAGLLLGIEISN